MEEMSVVLEKRHRLRDEYDPFPGWVGIISEDRVPPVPAMFAFADYRVDHQRSGAALIAGRRNGLPCRGQSLYIAKDGSWLRRYQYSCEGRSKGCRSLRSGYPPNTHHVGEL